MNLSPTFRLLGLLLLAAMIPHTWADERRAPAPEYSDQDLNGVFFEDLSKAFRGQRPTLSDVRRSAAATLAVAATPEKAGPSESGGDDVWSKVITPVSLEDEVKRLKLAFDGVVTTPGAFNSGGYMEARINLTALAMMFAVITEHSGDVRWKKQAPAARDLLARTAFNCKAGSTQVYNEAKLRKADLQDLVSGSGLSARDAESENDWGMVVDRSPLMEYAERLIESLEDHSRDTNSVKANIEDIRREAESLSVFGEVLTREGLDEADDEDYCKMSLHMVEASKGVATALERGDFDAVRKEVSAVRQRCDVCHNQYR